MKERTETQHVGNNPNTPQKRQVDDMNAVDATNTDISRDCPRGGPGARRIRIAATAFCAVFWGVLIYFALT